MYDTSRPYRVEYRLPPYKRVYEVEFADTIGDAKFLAGVKLASTEAMAQIVAQYGAFRRWHARLERDGVKLEELYTDGFPASRKSYESQRLAAVTTRIEREEARRAARRQLRQQLIDEEKAERSNRFGRGRARPIVCLTAMPPRSFRQVLDAAEWAGLRSHSTIVEAISEGRPAAGMRWQYADILLKELEDETKNNTVRENHAALVAAAQHALSMRERKEIQSVLPPQAGKAA